MDKEVNAASISSAPYTSSGFIDTKQAEYISTRIIYRPYYYSQGNGGDDYDYVTNPDNRGYRSFDGGNTWVSNKDLANVNLSNYTLDGVWGGPMDLMGGGTYNPATATSGTYGNLGSVYGNASSVYGSRGLNASSTTVDTSDDPCQDTETSSTNNSGFGGGGWT